MFPAIRAITMTASLLAAGVPQPALPILPNGTGGIKARVIGRTCGPMPGAQVILSLPNGRSWVALTGPDGRFKAGGLPPGTYEIRCKRPGYEGDYRDGVVIKAGAWLLGPPKGIDGRDTAVMPKLDFVGDNVYVYESGAGQMTVITREEMERLPL